MFSLYIPNTPTKGFRGHSPPGTDALGTPYIQTSHVPVGALTSPCFSGGRVCDSNGRTSDAVLRRTSSQRHSRPAAMGTATTVTRSFPLGDGVKKVRRQLPVFEGLSKGNGVPTSTTPPVLTRLYDGERRLSLQQGPAVTACLFHRHQVF